MIPVINRLFQWMLSWRFNPEDWDIGSHQYTRWSNEFGNHIGYSLDVYLVHRSKPKVKHLSVGRMFKCVSQEACMYRMYGKCGKWVK